MRHNGKVIGPFATEKVEELIANKKLPIFTEFCSSQGGEWLTIISFATVSNGGLLTRMTNMQGIAAPPPLPESVIEKSDRRLLFEKIFCWIGAIVGSYILMACFGIGAYFTPKGRVKVIRDKKGEIRGVDDTSVIGQVHKKLKESVGIK